MKLQKKKKNQLLRKKTKKYSDILGLWKSKKILVDVFSSIGKCADHNLIVVHHFDPEGKHFCPTGYLMCKNCYGLAKEPQPYSCTKWGVR